MDLLRSLTKSFLILLVWPQIWLQPHINLCPYNSNFFSLKKQGNILMLKGIKFSSPISIFLCLKIPDAYYTFKNPSSGQKWRLWRNTVCKKRKFFSSNNLTLDTKTPRGWSFSHLLTWTLLSSHKILQWSDLRHVSRVTILRSRKSIWRGEILEKKPYFCEFLTPSIFLMGNCKCWN